MSIRVKMLIVGKEAGGKTTLIKNIIGKEKWVGSKNKLKVSHSDATPSWRESMNFKSWLFNESVTQSAVVFGMTIVFGSKR